MELETLTQTIINALEDVKARDIKVFNTEELTDQFECVVIASGTSSRQTRALAYAVSHAVKEAGGSVIGMEGDDTGEWVLVDCGQVVCHVLQPNVRDYYNLAVGQHIADWAQEAVRGYLARFPRSWSVDLKEIRTEHRAGQTPAKLMQLEAERLLAAIEPGDFVVVLDEHGKDLTTVDLARQMHGWGGEGDRVVFVIGGPDGLAPEVKAAARATVRLSAMTLPHALARVLLAEQLYRVWSIEAGHPYHRA